MAVIVAVFWPIDILISYWLLLSEKDRGPTWYTTMIVGTVLIVASVWSGIEFPNLIVWVLVYLIGAWIGWKEDENAVWWLELVSFALVGYFWVAGAIVFWRLLFPS